MGKSNSQVVGYRYYASFLAFIGNRIENLIGINFDKRGWHTGRRVPMGGNGEMVYLHLPNIYGENEGGISGTLCVKYGSNTQTPDAAYKKYMESISSPVSAYPYQSYISFSGGELLKNLNTLTEEQLQDMADQYNDGVIPGQGFYVGNSGYMKEMLLWPKRIHVRNDGREQWYDEKAEINRLNVTIPESDMVNGVVLLSTKAVAENTNTFNKSGDMSNWHPDLVDKYVVVEEQISDIGYAWSNSDTSNKYKEDCVLTADIKFPQECDFIFEVTFNIDSTPDFNYTPIFLVEPSEAIISSEHEESYLGGSTTRCFYRYKMAFGAATLTATVEPHNFAENLLSNRVFPFNIRVFYPNNTKSLNINEGDINPIHKIREILTDDTSMARPEVDVNDINFIKAADRIWDEGLGVSWAIDEKSCIDAIEELCYHIEAGIRVNRQTGLYEMVLFRDDWFAEDEIHSIAENKIKDLSLEVMNGDDIVNQLNVTYYDRERIKNSTFSIYENGSILTMGKANAESIDFPYFMNMRNAEIVANWKLKQFSTPAWSGSFTTGWKEARKWNRYDLIRLPWSSKWNGTILARIMKINLGNGTDNTVTIDFEEVIPYSGEMNTSIVVDAPVESAPQPPQPSMNTVFEAPYYLTVLRAGQTNADLELSNNPYIGYVAAIASKPQSNSLNALLYTDGGIGEFEQVSRLDYCDILQLDQPIIETTASFTVTGVLTQTANSNNMILLNDELMGFVSFDDATKVLTVKRGVLDTVPKKHSSGSLFVFDLPDVAFDSTQYAQSEVVEAQVLTTTPSGIQELSATGVPIEIQSRAIRPYPPANVKINDAYYPETIIVTNDIVLTWVDRNRLQQTGGAPLGFFDEGVAVEQGVNYSYELVSEAVVLDSASGITGNTATILSSVLIQYKPHTLKLWSVRDGYDSYQVFEHSFFVEPASLILTATTDGSSVVGNTVSVANISVNADESLSANMQFDGSSISGKAEAGATITIEIQE